MKPTRAKEVAPEAHKAARKKAARKKAVAASAKPGGMGARGGPAQPKRKVPLGPVSAARKRTSTKAAPRAEASVAKAAPRAKAIKPAAGKAASRGQLKPDQAAEIATRLARAVPDALCELRFENAFQLVIATILSAQSTDKAVNAVTPALFARFPTPAALAASDPDEVEALIKRTGFFRAKTRSIRGTAQLLVAEFGGEVPRTLEQLVRLPGVARKTANVVLGTAYGIAAGFVVDTHVTRVSQRLALTQESDPVKIEAALCQLFPREQWVDMGHRVLLHGRYTCLAKSPMCEVCPLSELCPSRLTDLTTGSWETLADAEAQRVHAGMAGA